MIGLFFAPKFQTTWSNGFRKYIRKVSPGFLKPTAPVFGHLLKEPTSTHCPYLLSQFPLLFPHGRHIPLLQISSPRLGTSSEKRFALCSSAPSKVLCANHIHITRRVSVGALPPSECRERGAGRRRKEKVRASQLTPHLFVSSPCGFTLHPLLQWESAC